MGVKVWVGVAMNKTKVVIRPLLLNTPPISVMDATIIIIT